VGPSEGNNDGTEEDEGTRLGKNVGDLVGNGARVGAFVGTGAVGRFEIVGAFVIGTKERGANVEGRKEGDLVCMGAEGADVFVLEIKGDIVGLLRTGCVGAEIFDVVAAEIMGDVVGLSTVMTGADVWS